jgi:hypothetical protein
MDETADPSQWQVRTDKGARKIVERIDAWRSEVAALKNEVGEVSVAVQILKEGTVTWQRFLAIAGAVVLSIAAFAAFVLKSSKDDAAAVRADLVQTRRDTAEDVRQVRAETAGKVSSIDAKVEGLYQHIIRGKPRRAVEAEVKKSTEDAGR